MIPEKILFVLNRLEQSGFEAYAVGGCVRDRLLEKEPCDWDITTSALPEQTKSVFSDFYIKDNGLKHGTVSVFIDKTMIEITTYRIDGEYKDSRRPEKVEFTSSLKADLARRDFTVNAMAMDKNENIIDCFGGKKDLKKRIIRCVGDPEKRFSEDALRIMRGLRFASLEGFILEDRTLEAAIKMRENLNSIARERIYAELKKMLMLPNCAGVMKHTYPIFKVIFPTLKATPETWKTVCTRIKKAGTLELKLATLLTFCSAEDELTRMKADNKLKKKIKALFSMRSIPLKMSRVYLQKLMCAYGKDEVIFLCEYKVNMGNANREIINLALDASYGCTSIKELNITGNDIKAAGYKKYKIKEALNALLKGVVEEKCKNTEESLKEYLIKLKKVL